MADVTMPLERGKRLPRLCIVCGSSDCNFERVTIRPNVSQGGMVVLANRGGYSVLTLTLPLCSSHRYHFAFQTILRYLAITAIIGTCLIGLVLLAIFDKGWIVGVMIAAVLGMVVLWVITSMVANRTRVHLSGYSGDAVVFSNASSKFARALGEQENEDEDEEEDEEEEEKRPRGRARPPKLPKESDEDEGEEQKRSRGRARPPKLPVESDEDDDFDFNRR